MTGDSSFTEAYLTKAVPLLGLTVSPEATEVCPTSMLGESNTLLMMFLDKN